MTKEMDERYLQAVESGDMATAQQMVNEVAAKAMPETTVLHNESICLVQIM